VPFSRTEPNVPDFEEDGNSPAGATGVSSFTFNFSTPVDHAVVYVDSRPQGSTPEPLQLQLVGDTLTVYDFVDNTGSTTRDASQFDVSPSDGGESTARIELVGQPNSGSIAIFCQATDRFGVSGTLTEGVLRRGFSLPIDQFTLFQPTDNISVDVEVFGRGVFD